MFTSFSFFRYSCFTAPIHLSGLSSNCQNLDAVVELSFFIQRFSAADPTTCAAHGLAYNISTTVNLALPTNTAEASLPPPVASAVDGAASTSSADDATPLPAVLAVFQLQLDLSGRAGAAWMNSLSGAGPSSDVQVLGHDVGLLLALPSACDAAATANMVASISSALGPSGGAVRSSSCLPGPAYSGLSAEKVSAPFLIIVSVLTRISCWLACWTKFLSSLRRSPSVLPHPLLSWLWPYACRHQPQPTGSYPP